MQLQPRRPRHLGVAQVVSSLSSRAEPSADNREMKVQVLQGGLMVVESEAVEERGREPRRSGCKSHRSPQGSVEGKVTWAGCNPVATAASWVRVPALPPCRRRPTGRVYGPRYHVVEVRILSAAPVPVLRRECEFSAWSHTPGHAGATPASATTRRCRPIGRVGGFKLHSVRVRVPPAVRSSSRNVSPP